MNRSFNEFLETGSKNEFLNGLSFIAGVPGNNIYNAVFRKGCVIFEGELDGEADQGTKKGIDLFFDMNRSFKNRSVPFFAISFIALISIEAGIPEYKNIKISDFRFNLIFYSVTRIFFLRVYGILWLNDKANYKV